MTDLLIIGTLVLSVACPVAIGVSIAALIAHCHKQPITVPCNKEAIYD